MGLLKKRCFEMLDANPVQFLMQSRNLDFSLLADGSVLTAFSIYLSDAEGQILGPHRALEYERVRGSSGLPASRPGSVV